jgi:hypothetical protein
MHGSPDPLEADAFLAYMEAEIERLERKGGFLSIVLHLPLFEWLGDDRLAVLLDVLAATDTWVARCDKVAEHVLAHTEDFEGKATLDSTTWS